MAIPYFFRPATIDDRWVVDGGMQNNYPVYALIDRHPDLVETSDFVGLFLGTKGVRRSGKWLVLDLWSIWADANDEEALEEFIDRTVVIDPRPIRTIDFTLTDLEVEFLLAEGRASALEWCLHWGRTRRHVHESGAPGLDAGTVGPTEQIVSAARIEADRLRELVVTQRFRRLASRAVALLFLLLLSVLLLRAYLL